jgi:hypothetical protein
MKCGNRWIKTEMVILITKRQNNRSVGISKTMQRMKNDYELIAGIKYGTYRLPVEDINSINAEQTDIEMKKKFSCL